MSYSEKLKDPRWQKKRLEILERDGWKCMACGDKKTTLHVHHIFYFYGKDPWDINSGFLITFCERCHRSAPCDDKYQSCSDCPEYPDSCSGPGNGPEDIVECIGNLLNAVWKTERFGDYFSCLGFTAHLLGGKHG